ncbi:hypothetical protein [Geobacillus thermodenitrificans]|uniref:Uncharacterized protein n=1 Tax=Geobacillus thermodenitrificans TaxID=33940 RepID=A0ABY9QFS8_GEOTD|nr:hypothetical protein [Geobacillus thermodenitrificans]MEC5186469.1 putative Ntn-hydrolase superfamily protein [Geobacillus thermodenitrificans]MED3904716.1 hypothetical protein [Geobacillus thermodenitrificans]WMV77769.1 hypothetical protein HSX42_08530 [Geobacillus thermodenitrificans]
MKQAKGPLAAQLLRALPAAEEDHLLVGKEGGDTAAATIVIIDWRIDDHPQPIEELVRLPQWRQLYFKMPRVEKAAMMEGMIKDEVGTVLFRLGCLREEEPGDGEELTAYVHTKSFEEREVGKDKDRL